MSKLCKNMCQKDASLTHQKIPYHTFLSSCKNFNQRTKEMRSQKLSFMSDSVKNELTSYSPHSPLFQHTQTTKDEDTLSYSHKSVSSDQKRQTDIQRESIKIFEEDDLHEFRKYFRDSDWYSLLYILEKARKQRGNAPKLLWNFINKFEGKRKISKGKKVFRILQYLELAQVMNLLIKQQQKEKRDGKFKKAQSNTLLFNLVHKIA